MNNPLRPLKSIRAKAYPPRIDVTIWPITTAKVTSTVLLNDLPSSLSVHTSLKFSGLGPNCSTGTARLMSPSSASAELSTFWNWPPDVRRARYASTCSPSTSTMKMSSSSSSIRTVSPVFSPADASSVTTRSRSSSGRNSATDTSGSINANVPARSGSVYRGNGSPSAPTRSAATVDASRGTRVGGYLKMSSLFLNAVVRATPNGNATTTATNTNTT